MSDWFRKLVTKAIRVNGVELPNQPALNLVAGTGVELEVQNRPVDGETRVTISATAELTSTVTPTDVAGTTYTLLATDLGRSVRTSSSSAVTITVPPQSDVAWPTGALIHIRQLGAGQVTVQGGSGVTITPSIGRAAATSGQPSAATLERTAEDEWFLYGDLEEST